MKGSSKIFWCVLFLLTSTVVRCQNSVGHLDTLVGNFVAQLKAQKVDTICVYQWCNAWHQKFYGKDDTIDRCYYADVYEPNYILWRKNGKSFLTEMDNCFNYSVIETNAQKVWKYFSVNKEAIKKEKMLSFQVQDKQSNLSDTIYTNTVSSVYLEPGEYYDFRMMTDHDTTELYFDELWLEDTFTSIGLYGKPGVVTVEYNINYSHNMKLKSKSLADMINDIVTHANEKKLLEIVHR